MKNSTINGEEITDELRRKIASRLRGKAKIATPDTVDSLLMEAVYGDDVMGGLCQEISNGYRGPD